MSQDDCDYWFIHGLSHLAGGRFEFCRADYISKELWQQVKPTVRSIEHDGGVLIFDDTIQEKTWTDESELMCWHFDHCSVRTVKGINLLNALYYCNGTSIPVAFELMTKPIQCAVILHIRICAAGGK